jgi:hypothetical protein
MPTDEEIREARQDFEPEYPSGDEKRFQGSQAEQAQNQRTVTQQKKHDEFYKQELRQTGKTSNPPRPFSHSNPRLMRVLGISRSANRAFQILLPPRPKKASKERPTRRQIHAHKLP